MATELFSRAHVRYEVAIDAIGAVIAHHSEIIGNELQKPEPDLTVIQAQEAQKKALRDARESLDANDSTAIEQAIATYAPMARTLYE